MVKYYDESGPDVATDNGGQVPSVQNVPQGAVPPFADFGNGVETIRERPWKLLTYKDDKTELQLPIYVTTMWKAKQGDVLTAAPDKPVEGAQILLNETLTCLTDFEFGGVKYWYFQWERKVYSYVPEVSVTTQRKMYYMSKPFGGYVG